LFWRLPILVIEEAWHLVGELPSFLRKHSEAERDWRAQYYYLTLSVKSKDCYAFPNGVIHPLLSQQDCPEQRLISGWLNELSGQDPMVIADPVFEFVLKRDPLNEYEIAALSMLRARAFRGGKYNDRLACVIGMLLLVSRGLDREAVKERLAADMKAHAEKPKTLDKLPWYCYDKHTRLGLLAASILEKKGVLQKHKLSMDDFKKMWTYRESFFVPNEKLSVPKIPDQLTAFDSYWWPRLVVSMVPKTEALRWKKLRPVVSRLIVKLQNERKVEG